MTVLSIFVLVILGIPASGIAIPVDMTPAFFEHLHPVLPTSAVLDGLRRVIYFGGRGIAGDIATLTLWLALGGVLIWASKLRKPKAPASADENVLLEVVV
jgi:ABC-type multidrug transport system permease subunit